MAGSSSTPPPSTSTPWRAPASNAAEASVRGFPALAFDDYHRRVLPARCRSGAGRAAARDVRGARPIAFLLTDGRAYRLTPGADAIAVEPGAEAPTVVELDPRTWSDFVHVSQFSQPIQGLAGWRSRS